MKTSRNEKLASMNSDTFRIDVLETTPAELRHAKHRLETMSWDALETRIAKMTSPFKLIAFIRACNLRGLKTLAMDARKKLNIVLDVRDSEIA